MKKLICVLIAAIAAAGAAQAQTFRAGQAYVGAGVSAVDKLIRNGEHAKTKLFGGYDFDKNFGIEVGTINLGSDSVVYSSGNGQGISASVRGRASYLAGKYTIPVNQQLSAYAKLGMSYTVFKHSNNLNMNYTDSDTSVYAGLGMQYQLTQQVALTAEYERFGAKHPAGQKRTDAWTLGLKYGF